MKTWLQDSSFKRNGILLMNTLKSTEESLHSGVFRGAGELDLLGLICVFFCKQNLEIHKEISLLAQSLGEWDVWVGLMHTFPPPRSIFPKNIIQITFDQHRSLLNRVLMQNYYMFCKKPLALLSHWTAGDLTCNVCLLQGDSSSWTRM